MVIRGVYTEEEEKMLAAYREEDDKQVGWVPESRGPSGDFPLPAGHRVASKGLIINMACVADHKNPLWRDENYARNTRWGSIIAPPIFQVMAGGGGPHNMVVPPEAGILVGTYIGDHFEFFKPIYENDSFRVWRHRSEVTDVTRPGEQTERRFRIWTSRLTYINQRDEVVGTFRKKREIVILPPGSDIGNVYRQGAEWNAAENKLKMKFTEDYAYTKGEIEAIDLIYDDEEIRGAKVRYWEDVKVGEELKPIAMGPITVWDMVMEFAGNPVAINPMMELRRQPHNPEVNWDPVTNVAHMEPEFHLTKKGAEMMGFYSNTILQFTIEHFLARLVTNWMGDDGFMRKLEWVKLLNTHLGDSIFGRGKVVKKYIDENGDHLVDIDTRMETQRGYISNVGPATVSLLSKEKAIEKNEMPIAVTNPVTGKENQTILNIQGNNSAADIKVGDRIKIKERPDWPMPTGYKLANLEGTVFDTIDELGGYVLVLLDKEDATGIDPRVPLGFRADAIEKM